MALEFVADSVAFDHANAALAQEGGARTDARRPHGVIVKVVHGAIHGKGRAQAESPLAIHGPDDVARWAGNAGRVTTGLTCTSGLYRSAPIRRREAMIVAQAANAPGVKSLILDVEPYAGFWQGDAAAADAVHEHTAHGSVSNDLHVGISVDSRNGGQTGGPFILTQLDWQAELAVVHPQAYWHDFGLPFEPGAARMHRNAGRHRAAHLPGSGNVPEPAHGR